MNFARLPLPCRGPLLRGLLVALALAPPTRLAMAQPPAAATTVDIVLEDQFKNRRDTSQLRGDVVVLVYAERHGAEAALDLGRRLHLRFHPTAETAEATEWSRQPVVGLPGWPAGVRVPDVHVVPVACVPEVPRALYPVARTRLRQESPHVSVWLDFEDVLGRRFGMMPGEPNVALIDTQGRPGGVLCGRVDPPRFEQLVGAIDQLRMQAQPAVRTVSGQTASGSVVPVSGVR
jgi:hypothetical protein